MKNVLYSLQVVYKILFGYNKYVFFVFTHHIKPLEDFGYFFLEDKGAIK